MIWAVLLIASVVITLRQYAARHQTPPPKWQTPHTLMMKMWARAVGLEMGRAQREGDEPLSLTMHAALVRQAYSGLTPLDAYAFVLEEDRKLRNFADEELIKAELARRPSVMMTLEDARRAFMTAAGGQYNHLLACMIVATVVERRYGTEERGTYLVDVLLGNAR